MYSANKGRLSWAEKKKAMAILREAAPRYCSDYSVTIDGKKWKHQHDIEPFAAGWLRPFPGSDALKGIIGWYVSTAYFERGQERNITIKYKAAHDRAGSSTSNDTRNAAPVFRYRLSTGGVWAGPIVKGKISVKFVGAESKWAEIKKPAGKFKRLIATEEKYLGLEF